MLPMGITCADLEIQMLRRIWILPLLPILFSIWGCASSPSSNGEETQCLEAERRLGFVPCVHRVDSMETWSVVSTPAAAPGQIRVSKYMVPARADARLAGLFMNVNQYLYHLEFMVQAFPDLFSGLSSAEYVALIQDPEQREFFAGTVTEYAVGGEAVLYGYTVWDDPAVLEGTISCAQLSQVHAEMEQRLEPEPVVFVPSTQNQRLVLKECPVASYDADLFVKYQAYTTGVAYGTLRRYTLAELQTATENAEFGWQDILVLDETPFDLETVISGAVTGTLQGELSHLAIRSASRGTPNCYVEGAYSVFSQWAGKLVRFECGDTSWSIEEASLDQAEAWWASLKPAPIEVPTPDLGWDQMLGLLDLPTDSKEQRALGIQRYGSKGANLATLYQLPAFDGRGQYSFPGFLIPFSYYQEFMDSHFWSIDLGNGPQELSFAQTVAAYLQDAAFKSDNLIRRQRLENLRAAMRSSLVDPLLIAALTDKIREVYGADQVMVRFRSSSNAEDALHFNGAGLYDSTSACLADELDGDEVGPSHCDPDQSKERSLNRALTKVWASLWNMGAFEERAWYGIDHLQTAMGILVNTRTKNEEANIVAFSGNPTVADDDRYLINAQIGELDVVSPPPGVFPEKLLLRFAGGSVTEITRVSGSSELPYGEQVLSDAQLQELGDLFWQIATSYPLDGQIPNDATLLLDTEWKVQSGGQLVIKQIRPFLK